MSHSVAFDSFAGRQIEASEQIEVITSKFVLGAAVYLSADRLHSESSPLSPGQSKWPGSSAGLWHSFSVGFSALPSPADWLRCGNRGFRLIPACNEESYSTKL